MSTRPRPVTVLLVVGVVPATALPVVAVVDHRDRPGDTTPPVRVSVSETVDISRVDLSGGRGRTIDTDETTPTATPTPTATSTPTAPPTATPSSPATEGSASGFGATGVALAALVASLLAVRRFGA